MSTLLDLCVAFTRRGLAAAKQFWKQDAANESIHGNATMLDFSMAQKRDGRLIESEASQHEELAFASPLLVRLDARRSVALELALVSALPALAELAFSTVWTCGTSTIFSTV